MTRQPYFIAILLQIFVTLSFAQTTHPSLPTLWIVGDSTVKNGTPSQKGWGEVISPFFDLTKINVQNRAIGGRSTRTFMTDGRWDKILSECKPGDFVLIQLGHNDGGPVNDNTRARGTLRGIGEESQEIDNQLTHQHELVHTYGWYLRKYVQDSKAHGLTAIICSPVPRFPEAPVQKGQLEKSDYVRWSQQIADEQHVPFIQLNGLIMDQYAGLQPDEIKAKYFTPIDNTHTNPAGAELNARCVIQGIRGLKDCPLSGYLKPQASTQPG